MRLIKDSIWSTGLTFLVSIVSFGSQLLIANFFGTSKEFDSFLAVTSIPTLFSALLVSGINYVVFPELVKRKNIYGENLNGFTLVLFFIFSTICLLFLLAIFFVLYNLTPLQFLKIYKLENNTALIIFVWLNSFFSILLGLLNSYFNSTNKFKTPILFSIISYFVSILIILVLNKKIGISSVALGMLLGTFCTFLFSFHQIFIREKVNICFKQMSIDAIDILKKMPLASLAMLCFSIYQTIDTIWASSLGASNLSYLGYGQRIIISVGALIIAGPFTVFVPKLTSDFINHNFDNFYKNIVSIIKTLLILSFFIVMLFSQFSNSIITLLFQRGKFNANDTKILADIVPILMIGMIFMLCSAIVFRIFFITNTYKKALFLSLLTTVFYIVLSGFLSAYFLLLGICYAYIISWFFTFFIGLFMLFKHKLSENFNKRFFRDLCYSIGLNLILYVTIKLEFQLFEKYELSYWTNIIVIFITSISSIFIYLRLLSKLDIYEIKILVSFLLPNNKKNND